MNPERELRQTTSILERIGAEIAVTAAQLSDNIQQNHYQLPSFDVNTPIQVLPSTASQEAHELRRKLKRDALTLFRLASGPSEYTAHLSMNVSGRNSYPKFHHSRLHTVEIAFESFKLTCPSINIPLVSAISLSSRYSI